MNPRIYKKLCKRTEDYIQRLDRDGSFSQGVFSGTTQGDELKAPAGMDAPVDQFGDFMPLHNTRCVSHKTSYEYDEWDSMYTMEWLQDLLYWTFVEISDPGPVEDWKVTLTIPLTR